MFRRGARERAVSVSDITWQNWTGKSPRLKEYAIAGLKQKGLMISGHGDDSRYAFEIPTWEQFVKSIDTGQTKTFGRKDGVAPKDGARVDPECRERGCALMARKEGHAKAAEINELNRLVEIKSPATNPIAAPAKPQKQWQRSLGAIHAAGFPLSDLNFIRRLLSVVKPKFANVQDEELAFAIKSAAKQKSTVQKSEGLFLTTVPLALAHIRRVPAAPATSAPPDPRANMKAILETCRAGLQQLGGSFLPHVETVDWLLAWVDSGSDNFEELDGMSSQLELDIAATAAAIAPPETLTAAREAALARLDARFKARNHQTVVESTVAGMIPFELLKLFELPRLNLLYA